MKKILILFCCVTLFSTTTTSFAQKRGFEEEILCDSVPTKLPLYKGGDIDAFISDLKASIVIPKECSDYEVNGEVEVSFVITKKGKIKNVKVTKSPFNELANSIQRAFEDMRGWTAAEKDGKKVNYKVTIKVPFSFIKDKNNVGAMFSGVNSKGFEKYIQKTTTMPKEAMVERSEGVVKVQFTVQKNGQPTNFRTITTPSDILTNDLIEMIKKQGSWTPALKDGLPIAQEVTILTTYKLPQKLDVEPMYRINDMSYILNHDPLIDLAENASIRGGHDMEFDWYIYKDGRCELRNNFSSSLRMFYNMQSRYENWNWRAGKYGGKDVSVRYHVTIKGGMTYYDTHILKD